MANKVLVETSARHVHLTEEHIETLFGKGHALTHKKDLSQPGQFACEERVTVVGPKTSIANVIVLGPARPASQVEVSLTDARTLGVEAPVRESGDVAGSGACKLVGPAGEVELTEGVIAANDGYDTVPCCSAWGECEHCSDDVVEHFVANCRPEKLLGFMTAPWVTTTVKNLGRIEDSVKALAAARDKFIRK